MLVVLTNVTSHWELSWVRPVSILKHYLIPYLPLEDNIWAYRHTLAGTEAKIKEERDHLSHRFHAVGVF